MYANSFTKMMNTQIKNTYRFFSYFGKFDHEETTTEGAIKYAKEHADADQLVIFLPNMNTYLYLHEFVKYYDNL